MDKRICIACIVFLASFASTLGDDSTPDWPRRDAVVGLWPLNGFYKVRDISGNGNDGTQYSYSAVDSIAGPFGDPQTSMSCSSSYCSSQGIFQMTKPIALNDSFTISFFIKSSSSYSSGLFQWVDRSGNSRAFSLNHFSSTPGYIRTYANSVSSSKAAYISPSTAWNFYAITFSASNCTATIYNRFGVYVKSFREQSICDSMPYNNNGFRIGSTSYSSWSYSAYASLSCLAVYSDALSDSDVIKIYDGCRVILNAAPCGASRLPAIPAVPGLPPIPARSGQFPALAFLRENGKFKCGAAIISPYWVMTAASCIDRSLQISFYTVYFGYNDPEVSTAYSKSSAVKSFIIHNGYSNNFGFYQVDIALIELSTALDMSNAYVNDICLPWYSDANISPTTGTSYLAGFGANGRSSVASQTAVRYMAGTVQDDLFCQAKWGSIIYKPETMMCLLSDYDADVPCTGDEGGPLMVARGQHYQRLVAVGIYSYRNKTTCSDTAKPPIFTEVAAFISWIHEKIGCIIPGYQYPAECPL